MPGWIPTLWVLVVALAVLGGLVADQIDPARKDHHHA